MSARERIMTIRLMEKLQAHPTYAKALGITGRLKNCTGEGTTSNERRL